MCRPTHTMISYYFKLNTEKLRIERSYLKTNMKTTHERNMKREKQEEFPLGS